MVEGLRDIVGVLMTLGLILLLRRLLFRQKPPAKHRRPNKDGSAKDRTRPWSLAEPTKRSHATYEAMADIEHSHGTGREHRRKTNKEYVYILRIIPVTLRCLKKLPMVASERRTTCQLWQIAFPQKLRQSRSPRALRQLPIEIRRLEDRETSHISFGSLTRGVDDQIRLRSHRSPDAQDVRGKALLRSERDPTRQS
jgi:hypothetical protein